MDQQNQTPATTMQTPQPPVMGSQPMMGNQPGNKNMLLVIVSIVMLVVAGVLLYVFVLQPTSQRTTYTNPATTPNYVLPTRAPTPSPAQTSQDPNQALQSLDVATNDADLQDLQKDSSQL